MMDARVTTRMRSGAAALLAVAVLAACGGGSGKADVAQASGATNSDTASLVSAAQREGTLVWYSAVPKAGSDDTAAAFKKKYGISVQLLQMPGSKLLQRFSAEATAGAYNADVIIGTGLEKAAQGELGQWLTPIKDAKIPAADSFPGQFMLGKTAIVSYIPWVIGYNTKLVAPADVPKTFQDLGDPKWKGKFATTDPAASTAYIEVWDRLMSTYGVDFLKAIGANHPRLFDSAAAANEALAAGEVSVGAPTSAPALAAVIKAGAPIKFVQPQVTTGAEMQLALVKQEKVAHPNAARLFVQYLMTIEGNKKLAEAGGDIWVLDSSKDPSEIKKLSAAGDAATRKEEILNNLGFK